MYPEYLEGAVVGFVLALLRTLNFIRALLASERRKDSAEISRISPASTHAYAIIKIHHQSGTFVTTD